MSADRELLYLAAKATGRVITGWSRQRGEDVAVLSDGSFWQPLLKNGITDCDGDALRLAVKLHLALSCGSHMKRSWADRNDIGPFFGNWDMHEGDEDKAMRYAIVRAAAEIGRRMP